MKSKVLILILGTSKTDGGMYEYAMALKHQYESDSNDVHVLDWSCLLEFLCISKIEGKVTKRVLYWFVFSLLYLPVFRHAFSFLIKRSVFKKNADKWIIADQALFNPWLFDRIMPDLLVPLWIVHDPIWHEERASLVSTYLRKRSWELLGRMAQSRRVQISVHSNKLIQGSPFQNLPYVVNLHPLPKVMKSAIHAKEAFRRLSPRRFVVSFVGRIEPYKGLDDLIEAIKVLDSYDEAKRIEFKVVGSGCISGEINKIESIQVSVTNKFVTDEEVHMAISTSDLVVLPYRTATQSGVGYLAIAYRIPLLVTNAGALSDLALSSPDVEVLPVGDVPGMVKSIRKRLVDF